MALRRDSSLMKPAVIRREEGVDLEKHGVRMHVYTRGDAPAGIVYQETESGHAEEFCHEKSAFIYYIIEGEGVYVIGGVEHHVGAGDVVVVPPKSSIYFKGRLRAGARHGSSVGGVRRAAYSGCCDVSGGAVPQV